MNAPVIKKAPASIEQKLANARAAVAKYEALLAQGGGAKVIPVYTAGQEVTFNYGRGENKKQLVGKVLGQGKLGNGTTVVSIMSGEGIEASLFKVPVGDVVAPASGTGVTVDPVAATATDETGYVQSLDNTPAVQPTDELDVNAILGQ